MLEIFGPEESEAEVQRLRCRAIKDDQEGWVTVSGAQAVQAWCLRGNNGTAFLEDYTGVYKVVKEGLRR